MGPFSDKYVFENKNLKYCFKIPFSPCPRKSPPGSAQSAFSQRRHRPSGDGKYGPRPPEQDDRPRQRKRVAPFDTALKRAGKAPLKRGLGTDLELTQATQHPKHGSVTRLRHQCHHFLPTLALKVTTPSFATDNLPTTAGVSGSQPACTKLARRLRVSRYDAAQSTPVFH